MNEKEYNDFIDNLTENYKKNFRSGDKTVLRYCCKSLAVNLLSVESKLKEYLDEFQSPIGKLSYDFIKKCEE